jgi:hypothetical protein
VEWALAFGKGTVYILLMQELAGVCRIVPWGSSTQGQGMLCWNRFLATQKFVMEARQKCQDMASQGPISSAATIRIILEL